MHEIIRFAGVYRFDSRDVLTAALASARSQIAEEDDVAALEGGWLRCFVMRGTSLTVNLAMPAVAELRFAAAEIFTTLSRAAIEGSVEARIGDIAVDCFPWGDED